MRKNRLEELDLDRVHVDREVLVGVQVLIHLRREARQQTDQHHLDREEEDHIVYIRNTVEEAILVQINDLKLH